MKRYLYSLNLLIFIPFACFAQSAERSLMASGGGTFSNASFSIDYSVGEAVVSTFSAAGLTFTQGFQQPPYSDVSIPEPGDEGFIVFYPNPGRDLFHLNLYSSEPSSIEIQVIDILGQVVYSHRAVNPGSQVFELDLMLGFLSTGTYILRVSDGVRAENLPFVKVSM